MKRRTCLLTSVICVFLFVFCCGAAFGSVPSLDTEGEPADGSAWVEPPDLPKEIWTENQSAEYRETVSGKEYLVIRPDTEQKDLAVCLLLLPRTEDLMDFLAETEWDLAAAQGKCTLLCCQADWSALEEAENYLEEIFQELTGPLNVPSTAVFLAGYEEAADYAAREALLHTSRYTGLVTLGGDGLPEDLLAEYSGETNEDHALSVWIIAPKKTKLLTRNIVFWKNWNGIDDSNQTSFQSTFTSELYLPVTSSASEITDHHSRMGAVMFSRCEEYREPDVSQDVSRCFLSGVRTDGISFWNSITGRNLIRIDDLHFSYHRKQMDGQQRDYWMYVPDSAVFGNEPASLILCLHGNGGSGEDMIFRSMWHNTAAENNCIVLYPSSLYISGSQHYWLNIKEELDFLRALVEETCEQFRIDHSHIYVTGFSNGAGMAQNLAVRCSDIFAAAALSAPVYFDEEYYIGPINEVHAAAILFSYGTEDEYLQAYHMTADINDVPAKRHLEYWRALYGFQQEFYKMEEKGKFTVYTYGSMNHVPVCQWIVVEGKDHDYPEEETYIYYEFMKHFSKTEDGELYYDDQLVQIASNSYLGKNTNYE